MSRFIAATALLAALSAVLLTGATASDSNSDRQLLKGAGLLGQKLRAQGFNSMNEYLEAQGSQEATHYWILWKQ